MHTDAIINVFLYLKLKVWKKHACIHNLTYCVGGGVGRQYKACGTWKMAGEERNTTVVLGLMSQALVWTALVCAVRIQGSDHLKYVYATRYRTRIAVLVHPYLFYGCSFEILGFLTHQYPCGLKQDLLRVCTSVQIYQSVILVNSSHVL